MQELLFPHSKVVVLPDESDSVTLSDEDRARLAKGDAGPIAEQQMEALESLGLGTVAVTGYSRGGLTGARLAKKGSDKLEIVGLNIDEPPSERGRDEKGLKKDFKDGGLKAVLDLRSAIRESQIPALDQAMSDPRLAYDLARFGVRNLVSKDAKLIRGTMTGSSNGLIQDAAEQVGLDRTKVGSVLGSPMYGHLDRYSLQQEQPIRAVQYVGEGFRGHASADNVILHAGMVYDGLRSAIGER